MEYLERILSFLICALRINLSKYKNQRSIHHNVFGPRPLNVLGFGYARMALVYILFVGTPDSK